MPNEWIIISDIDFFFFLYFMSQRVIFEQSDIPRIYEVNIIRYLNNNNTLGIESKFQI